MARHGRARHRRARRPAPQVRLVRQRGGRQARGGRADRDVLTGTYVEPSTRDGGGVPRRVAHRTPAVAALSAPETHYRDHLEKHLKPALGRSSWPSSPLHIENFMTAQVEQKGLAQATVDKHFWTLHKALDRAVAWGQIPRNPADQVVKPRLQDSEVRSFDVNEQARILGRAAGTWQYGPILVALATGMRRGEIVALRWRDVDLQGGVVAVRGSVKESSTGVELGRAKTDASIRRSASRGRRRASSPTTAPSRAARQRGVDLPGPRPCLPARGRPDEAAERGHRPVQAPLRGARDRGRPLPLPAAHVRHRDAARRRPGQGRLRDARAQSIAITLRTYAHVLEDMQEAAAVQAGTLLDRALVIAG